MNIHHEKSPHYPMHSIDFKGQSDYKLKYLDSPRNPAEIINPISKIKLGLGINPKEIDTLYNTTFSSFSNPSKTGMIYPKGYLVNPQNSNPHQYKSDHKV